MSIDTMTEATALLPRVVDLRRKIHANPELGNQLPETTEAVLADLADLDLEYRYSQETTGFVATLRGAGNGPRIMLRADMDALPMPEDNDPPRRVCSSPQTAAHNSASCFALGLTQRQFSSAGSPGSREAMAKGGAQRD